MKSNELKSELRGEINSATYTLREVVASLENHPFCEMIEEASLPCEFCPLSTTIPDIETPCTLLQRAKSLILDAVDTLIRAHRILKEG